MANLRDNLLVIAGAKAAYMDCSSFIDIPGRFTGEESLADYVTEVVDKYINERIDISFDEYLEGALIKKYK